MTETPETTQETSRAFEVTFDSDSPTVKQAAEVLKVDPARVRQWLKDGRLEAVEGSDPVRVSMDSVLRLRDLRASNPPPAPKPVRKSSEEVEQLRAELQQERAKREALEAETRRELRALEHSAGRAEVLEQAVEDLKAERDSLTAQLEQLRQQQLEALEAEVQQLRTKRRGLFRKV